MIVLDDRATGDHSQPIYPGNYLPQGPDLIKSPPILEEWQRLGVLETLMSNGIKPTINANAVAQERIAARLRSSIAPSLMSSHALSLSSPPRISEPTHPNIRYQNCPRRVWVHHNWRCQSPARF